VLFLYFYVQFRKSIPEKLMYSPDVLAGDRSPGGDDLSGNDDVSAVRDVPS
jgi:hypothetical protein